MQKQNMNWFATVLRVVICFTVSVEVLCGWSVWSRRSRYEEKGERKELKLGDAQGTPSKYSRILKRLRLGMPRKASHLSSTSTSMFSSSFHSCDMCKSWSIFCVYFSFLFYAPCWYEIVHGWFIECSLHFTYIFWIWLYRMLHVLHLYHLKYGLPVSLHIENRCS